jgi:prefoldin subunit 5|tara:strand:+ start:1209 stop:1370 length:162 start_codon:yes stop_codon:yes gene_type:complete
MNDFEVRDLHIQVQTLQEQVDGLALTLEFIQEILDVDTVLETLDDNLVEQEEE